MSSEDIKSLEGAIISGPFWPENIKVLVVKQLGSGIQIIGSGVNTEKSYTNVLEMSEIDSKITIVLGTQGPNFSADPTKFRLALEAKRIRMSYEFDPLFAVGVSKIDPLPHQIEAVYDYLLKRPKIRFLLADDPGAGKTIMAGLLLKELKCRKAIERILIVVPPSLIGNWKEELYDKFDELFTEINREQISHSVIGPNIWEQDTQFIVSMDFAKQSDVLGTLRDARWDIVIVDEAHKFSAYQFKEKTEKSGRYRLGEVLSNTTEHLLFLTATPHKGDPDNFLLLLKLLDEDLYSHTKFLDEANRKNENQIMLRRLKETMRDVDGNQLFPPRKVNTISFKLTTVEKHLYDAVTDYLTTNYEKAEKSRQKNAVGFALYVLQRRLASSIRAITKSLERRQNKLRNRLTQGVRFQDELLGKDLTIEEIEEMQDLPEDQLWNKEDQLTGLTTAQNREELESEIEDIQKLIDIAKQAEKQGTEKKLNEVKRVLEEVEAIGENNEKLLIFSEHRDTTDYLIEKLQSWGFSVCCIDGTMNMAQRKKSMEEFSQNTQVMVATEAAGEGINLQFCSLMINYDIPWNPTRLEQRMGRIHRYKQKNEVHVYNMIASNTREGSVLETLFKKLEIMREHLGNDRVYDVIDELLEEENIRLDQLIRKAISNRASFDKSCQQFKKQPTEDYLKKIKLAPKEALAKQIDLTRYQEKIQIAEEQRLSPEYIEKFFVESFEDCKGVIKPIDKKNNLWKIHNIPIEIKKVLSNQTSQILGQNSIKISFNKEVATNMSDCEFVAPGTRLFDSLIEYVDQKYSGLLHQGSIFINPEGIKPQLLWFVNSRINDGKGRRIGERLFLLVEDETRVFDKKSPFILWDLNPGSKTQFEPFIDNIQDEIDNVSNWTLDNLTKPYFSEIRDQRINDLEIRERYIKKSMDHRISESITKLGKMQDKEIKGEDMRIAIQNEQHRQEEYKYRKKLIMDEINQEKNLSPSTPEIVAIAAIVPLQETANGYSNEMKRNDEVERIAMQVSMNHEIKSQRFPQDVSKDNLGYDIKSKREKELRYIEVKGRAGEGKIAVTPNEWIKACRFGKNYWLYIVVNCATKPDLYTIPDPASNIDPDKVVETRYIIEVDEWKQNATKI